MKDLKQILNTHFKKDGIKFKEHKTTLSDLAFKIEPASRYISDFSLTKSFYKELEKILKVYLPGFVPEYNNTKNIFWFFVDTDDKYDILKDLKF